MPTRRNLFPVAHSHTSIAIRAITDTATSFPDSSSTIGPPLFPGFNAASTWTSVLSSPGPLSALTIPEENFNDFMIKFLIKISSKPKKSLQIIKKLVNLDTNSKNAIQKERQEFYKLLDSKNKKIGIKSFILKKTPVWD